MHTRLYGFAIAFLIIGAMLMMRFLNTIEGQARDIDADAICIGAVEVRLYGIDAFEDGQQCRDDAGTTYDCGAKAREALRSIIGHNPVSCYVWDTDDDGRALATCSIGKTEINRAMVLSGWALRKYMSTYQADEEEAEFKRHGAWAFGRTSFETPWDWRTKHPAPRPPCAGG